MNMCEKYNICILEPFRNVLKPLLMKGWIITDQNNQNNQNNTKISSTNTITVNKLSTKIDTTIHVEYVDSFYHFSLPMRNSNYNYYTKIKYSQPAFDFFENYIESITENPI